MHATVHVRADAAAVLAAIDRQAATEPHAGVEVLARGPRTRVFGLTWRPRPGTEVRIVWDLRVEPTKDGVLLSTTRSFVAEDDDALRIHWRQVHESADLIGGTVLRAVKRAAEARPALLPVG